jgi:hypothetical protein
MNELLKLAVKGHGGMARWERISWFRVAAVSVALDVTNVTFS